MDGVHKELDEVKAEFEKLKEEYQIKTELSESLIRAHSNQITKIQSSQLQIEKQAKELNAKSEEIAEVRQLYEEIKAKLHETESSLKQVNYMNDKFRIDTSEKMQNLEGENTKLVSALEEATGRNEALKRKLGACSEEIEGLKSLLSDSQRKYLEAEEKVQAGRELRQRDDVILRLEEQSMNIQDQLKWKKEQFEHLEDAHKRLQDQFQSSKKEWVSEKALLLDEISTLQSKLDSQIRISEILESRLKMCNQALAHEESRRKMLEVQLSESKQCFENVLAECEVAKARIESLSTERDEEIAGLRNSLGMKETLMKEMDYRVSHLEQENKELLGCVKELQEAQINKRKPDPSLAKLRNKLKGLEQVHSSCALTLKEREAEWNSKMEKLLGDMKCYESDLKRQSEEMHKQSEELRKLKMMLDSSHAAMEISSEEISILLMVLKSELSNAYSRLFNSEVQIEAYKESEDTKAQVCIEQARNELAALTQKLDSLKLVEERSTMLEKELEEHKKILEDSSVCQLRMKEQITQMEFALKNASDALEKSNFQLAAKISEANQAEMELQMWKSKAQDLRTSLEEREQIYKQMETSLLEQVETEQCLRKENESLQTRLIGQEQRIDVLLQKTATLDQKLVQEEAEKKVIKLKLEEAQKKEVDYVQIIKARDETVEDLQKQIETIEQQSAKGEIEAENKFECEKEKLYIITREKDETISCLQGLASSLEQNFTDMFILSLSQGLENLVKMNTLEDTLKKTRSHMNAEMERKNITIDMLRMEVSDLRDKGLLQEQSLIHSEQLAKELEGLLESKKMEMENLVYRFSDEQAKLKEQVKNLEREKAAATDDIKRLSSERDSLVIYTEEICNQIGEIRGEDVKFAGMLGKMLQNSQEDAKIIPDKLCLQRSPLAELNQ